MRCLQTIMSATLLFQLSTPIVAEELQENFVPVRPLGMGNAFTAISNDENAIWTNPAGVSRARKHRSRDRFYLTQFPGAGGGINARSRAIYQAQQAESEKSLADNIAENGDLGEDKPYWTNMQLFPVMMFNYERQLASAFGLYHNTIFKMVVEEETPDQSRVQLVSDSGIVKNFTWTNWTNRFSAGIQVRYVTRYAYEDVLATEDVGDRTVLQERVQEDINQTSGLGVDAGMMLTLADFWFPTVGLSVFNAPTGCKKDYLNPFTKERQTVCGTVYTGDVGNDDALSTVDPTDIRAGVSITPRITRKVAFRLAFDVHHLYVPSGDTVIGLDGPETQKLMHGGIELFFGNPLVPSPFSLRAGVNQGFLTMGAGMRMAFLKLDFATYGVDIASGETPIEDRRYVGSMSLIF